MYDTLRRFSIAGPKLRSVMGPITLCGEGETELQPKHLWGSSGNAAQSKGCHSLFVSTDMSISRQRSQWVDKGGWRSAAIRVFHVQLTLHRAVGFSTAHRQHLGAFQDEVLAHAMEIDPARHLQNSGSNSQFANFDRRRTIHDPQS